MPDPDVLLGSEKSEIFYRQSRKNICKGKLAVVTWICSNNHASAQPRPKCPVKGSECVARVTGKSHRLVRKSGPSELLEPDRSVDARTGTERPVSTCGPAGGVFDEAGVQTLLIVAEVFAAQEDGNLGQMITSVATPSERRSY